MAGKQYTTTDPEVIRRWAETRHGIPVLFHQGGPESDELWPGFAFPDYNSTEVYEELSWQELFKKRDAAQLVFLYQEVTETGEKSLYHRFVSQQVADEAVSNAAAPNDPTPKSSSFGPKESHETPLARGKEGFRRHQRDQALSKTKMVGLIIASVLIAALILVTFWPSWS
jgi:hypothetical protein